MLAGLALVALAGCQSMRISGTVRDRLTAEPVLRGEVSSGPRVVSLDPIGRYQISVYRSWKTLDVRCPGYETRTLEFGNLDSRYPVIDVQLEPKEAP